MGELSAERRAIYASAVTVDWVQPGGSLDAGLEYSLALPGLDPASVVAVLCDDRGVRVQHLVHCPAAAGGVATAVMLRCKILMQDLSPTQMVEYRFADSGWMLSGMGRDACERYR